MPSSPPPEELSPEQALHLVAQAIDDAADRGDEDLNSRALTWCDQLEARLGSDEQRSLLDYFRANGWANRAVARRGDKVTVWAWDLEELGQQVFLLRRAVANPAFGRLDPVRRCQILTNLANQLDTAGRFVESRQIWARALALLPVFWMARANRGRSFMRYAHALYDPGHTAVFAMVAHRDLTEALDNIAIYPELGDARLKSLFASHAQAIEGHFDLAGIRDGHRPEGFSLGPSEAEQAYRRWCLNEGLFLNVLNDLGPDRRVAHVTGRMHTLWTDEYPADAAVTRLIERLRAPHRAALEAPVATAAERIGRRYKSESPFDGLAGEILREHTGANIAFLPGVGYGVSLEPGLVTREALMALLPHPAKVATVVLTGRQVQEVLEQSATNQKPDNPMDGVGGLVQTSGLQWTIGLTRPVGQRIRDVRVGNGPIDPGRDYRVVTHEGMLKGLHRYSSFAAGREPKVLAQSVAEVVEAALRRRGTVRAPALGNVTLIKPPDS